MSSEVTMLLSQYNGGDAAALNTLTRMIYPELKAMARRRTKGNQALGATTLVSETYVKLLAGGSLASHDRQQFFGLVATIMRQVIVDEVRYLQAQKRSGDLVTLADGLLPDDSQGKADFLLQVDRMLQQLEEEDPKLSRVFECRYFAGYSASETGEIMGVSTRTAERLWSAARERIAALLEAGSQ